MKISFVLPPVNMTGGIKVVAIYAKALVDRGHEVVLVSPPPVGIPIRRRIKSFVTGNGWPKAGSNRSHLDGLGLDHRVLERSRRVTDVDLPDADVVIATWWETAEWVDALGDSKGAKVYFIQHHEVHEHMPVKRSRATYCLPLHKIVIARWLQRLMREEYGDTDIDLVPNSVDHHQFFASVRGKQERPTVGFLYSTSKYKGVDVALEVVDGLRSIIPDLRVIAFGSVKPATNLEFDSQVEFHFSPPQESIKDLYSQCDLWLTASRTEGFNLPAMEAMACRTPVVSTKAGWPEEAIVNGKNGVLVDVDDVAALTQGAAAILLMTELEWCEMSENAFNTVATSNWRDSANMFEQALERVVGRHQNHPQSRAQDRFPRRPIKASS